MRVMWHVHNNYLHANVVTDGQVTHAIAVPPGAYSLYSYLFLPRLV